MTVFGAVYTGFLLAYLVLILRVFSSGMILAFAVVFSVWADDSLAYLVGSTFGRHKMAPRISPKKSWEGFIAGILGSMAVWLGMALLLPASGRRCRALPQYRLRGRPRGLRRRPVRVAHEA